MVDLKCPSCGANISIDDSREFGFCSYCGTKLQLVQKVKIVHEGTVNVAGIRTEEQQLISAKKMIELGEFSEARKLLKKIVEESPEYGEAWLELACINLRSFSDITGLLERNYFGECSKENTSSHIKERLLNNVSNSREYVMAQKILGNKTENICMQLVNRCNATIDDLLSVSNRKIQKYMSDFSLLSGYCTSTERTYCFFDYQGECYMNNHDYYYIVERKNNNTIHLTLKNFSLRTCPTAISIPRYISFDIVYIDNQNSIHTTIGTFHKDDAQTTRTREFYVKMIDRRQRGRECLTCGSVLSLFGSCKGHCESVLR